MKKLILTLLVTVCLAPRAQANNDAEWFGAALGAGIGLIIADNSHNIHPAVAIPVGAVAGGLIAHGIKEYRHRDNGYAYDNPYYDAYCGPGYSRDPYDRPYERTIMRVEQPVQARALSPKEAAPAPNLTPGVDLVKVSIALKNGTRIDVHLWRVGNKFIGPRGEEYPTLPTAEELSRKYGG
jgi:hypothetical protein